MKPTIIDEAASGVVSLALSADARTLAVGDDAGNVRLWSLDVNGKAEMVVDFQVELEALHAVALDAKGTRVAVVGVGGGSLHDRAGKVMGELPPFGGDELQAVTFTPDDARLLIAGDDERVRLWDPAKQAAPGAELRVGERNSSIVFHPNKRTFAVTAASQGGSQVVYGQIGSSGLSAGDPPPISIRIDALSSAAFSPDGEQLMVPARELRVYETASARLLAAYGEDGERLAKAPADGSVLLERAWSQAVCFGAGVFAAVATSGLIHLYGAKTGKKTATLSDHAGGSTALAGAGPLLVSAGLDNALRVWRY